MKDKDYLNKRARELIDLHGEKAKYYVTACTPLETCVLSHLYRHKPIPNIEYARKHRGDKSGSCS